MALVIGLVCTTLMLVAFFVAGALRWGGDRASDEEHEFCEAPRPGMIKEPANTWSNLGFVLSGLGMLLYLDVASQRPVHSPMAAPTAIAILYGCVVIWLGPGSMFLHASLKQWGGWLDNLSMNMFISFLIFYNIVRIAGLDDWVFWTFYITINVALGVLNWFWRWQHAGKVTFAVLIALAVLTEVLRAILGPARSIGWIIAAVVVFVIAFVIWQLSKTDGPLCRPRSLLQGHAAWHLLGAVATILIFVYLRSEGA